MESQSATGILTLGGMLLGLLWVMGVKNRPGPGLAAILAPQLCRSLCWPTLTNVAVALVQVLLAALWVFTPQVRALSEFAVARWAHFRRQRRARKAADLAYRNGSVTLDTVDGPVLFVAPTASKEIYVFPESVERLSRELLRNIVYGAALAGEDEFPVFESVTHGTHGTHGTVYSFCLDNIQAGPIKWTGVSDCQEGRIGVLKNGNAVMVGDIIRFKEPVRAPRRRRAPSVAAPSASPPSEREPAGGLFGQPVKGVEEPHSRTQSPHMAEPTTPCPERTATPCPEGTATPVGHISPETTGISAGETRADEDSLLESGGSDSEPIHLADAEPSSPSREDGSETLSDEPRDK
jgi:hypothetical protein